MKLPNAILAIALCEGAGILGSIFTFSSIPTWYLSLNKPFFAPPNFIFAPVWTILYALMGISLYLVWESRKKKNFTWFGVQLALNVFWSWVFFGLRNLPFSLTIIIALLISIIMTIKSFGKTSKEAGYLLIPYLIWVSFATLLNASIVFLNQ